MSFVLLALVIVLPLVVVAIGFALDRREKRFRGYVPDVGERKQGFFDRMANASIVSIVVDRKTRSAHRGPNYGDMGSDRKH